MTRVESGCLVFGPFPVPLTDAQQYAVDAMRIEAAAQDLSTLTVRTAHTYAFHVALVPRPTMEAL